MTVMPAESPKFDHSLSRVVGDPRPPHHELFPSPEVVVKHMNRATQAAAITAAIRINEFTGGKPEIADLSTEEKNRRVKIIDTDADTAFKGTLSTAPAEFYGIDAEGGKEADPSKLGEAMPLAIGVFGRGNRRATFVVDVVEGTTAAANGRPDAVSIAGVSTYDGIKKIPVNPQTGQDAHYFRKLFAPGEFKNLLSLDQSARDNLQAIMKEARIPADRITVAVMKRACNDTIVREASELGAKVELVSAGDLAWGLRAIRSNPESPIVMLGRGGTEEGSIAAVAAKALDATGQLRMIEEEKDIEAVDTTPIWTANEFVTGAREHSMVIFTAITPNNHFEMNGVLPYGKGKFVVESMLINSSGFKKREEVIDTANFVVS